MRAASGSATMAPMGRDAASVAGDPGRLDRLYARLPAWQVLLLAALTAPLVVSVAFTALNVVLLGTFLEGDRATMLRFLALAELADLAGLLVTAVLVARRPLLVLLRWLTASAPAPAETQAAFAAALDLPVRVIPVGSAIIMLCVTPLVAAAPSHIAASVSPLTIFLALLETVAAGALLTILICEQTLRPLARRALELHPGLVPHRSPLSLRRKLLVGLPIVNVMTGFIAVVLASRAESDEAVLSLGVVSALGVSLTVSLVLTHTLTRSLSEPVDLLVAATERVARGDLSARVEPLAGDELGVLAARFNAMVADLQRQTDALRGSRARIVAASDAARRRVERDLHDGAQQNLVLLRLQLAMARRALDDDHPSATALDEAQAELAQALAGLRDLAHGIYPAALTHEGLAAALPQAAQRAAVATTVDVASAARYPPELEAAVYFCCLEALQNTAKHAGDGARATVALREHDGALHFVVADDGPGFERTQVNGSAGLQNMADRIGALGGDLRIETSPGAGTRVTGRIPVTGGG